MDTKRAKAQDTRANPNSWKTHLVRKRWDIEPKDYDDDDDDDMYVMLCMLCDVCGVDYVMLCMSCYICYVM